MAGRSGAKVPTPYTLRSMWLTRKGLRCVGVACTPSPSPYTV